MALEDKALKLITRGPVAYDQLRAELSVSPTELDHVIANLERTRSIRRVRGRFELPQGVTAIAAPAPVATAIIVPPPPTADEEVEAIMKQKACTTCGTSKPLDEFPKAVACKDGHAGQCKSCINEKARARRLALEGPAPEQTRRVVRAAGAALPPPIASPAKQSAASQFIVLHVEGGVRIGPISNSASGLAQMPYHVDLSTEQLEQLLQWHQAARLKRA